MLNLQRHKVILYYILALAQLPDQLSGSNSVVMCLQAAGNNALMIMIIMVKGIHSNM